MGNNNNAAKDAIKAYLDNRAASDEQFAVTYKKEGKNLDECFQYIMGEARKRGTQVCMTDEEVFGLAVHYYDEDDIKINRNIGKSARAIASRPAPELTEAEKAQARETAIKRYEEECIKQDAAKARERKKTSTEKKKEQTFSMPTLFDFNEL